VAVPVLSVPRAGSLIWIYAVLRYFLLAFVWPAFVVLRAAVFSVILLTGRYPGGLRFRPGATRWLPRPAACAGPMTGQYPPFRLDLGGPGPVSTRSVAKSPASAC
jgi:hypothetical protein